MPALRIAQGDAALPESFLGLGSLSEGQTLQWGVSWNFTGDQSPVLLHKVCCLSCLSPVPEGTITMGKLPGLGTVGKGNRFTPWFLE